MNKAFYIAALAYATCAGAHAEFLPHCSKPVVTLSPPLPATLMAVPTAGHVAWSGQISVQINQCGAPTSQVPASLNIAIPINSSRQMPLAGVSGLSISGTGAPPTWSVYCGKGYSMQSNPEDSLPMGAPSSSARLDVQTDAGACSGITVNFPAKITATGGLISGTLSPAQLVDSAPIWFGGGSSGWVTFGNQVPVAGLGPYAVNVKPVQCTVAVANQVVSLPSMSASTLSARGVGSSVPFEVALKSCSPTSNPYGVNLQWNWLGSSNAGVASRIANTAPNGASNVSIQLLDDQMVPVENGMLSKLSASADKPNGLITRKFYARYHADGGPISSGSVSGVADFTIIYN